MVLDNHEQLHTRGDGQTAAVCDGLLPAATWRLQRALTKVPDLFLSHKRPAAHCTHMVCLLRCVLLTTHYIAKS